MALLLLVALLSVVFSQPGELIYKRYCSSCHSLYPPPRKAPPLSMITYLIKREYPKKEDFVRFVVDYITDPSPSKGLLMPMAYRMWGVMPPIGRSLTEEQKRAVAIWMFENF